MEVSKTYPESFRVIAQKFQKIDNEDRFLGHAIENREHNTAMTFDQQYFRLRAIFFNMVKSF